MPMDSHLASGSADGSVLLYDLTKGEQVATFEASPDAVNGVSIHPYIPLLATASGTRKYDTPTDSSDEEVPPASNNKVDGNCLKIWKPAVPYETENWYEGIKKRIEFHS